MAKNCTNCEHCRMRRTQVWCRLDTELKPAMSYVCDRHEPGEQWIIGDFRGR